jgi:hypothetical protein
MRCAVEQHREQSPDPADEEGGGQQVDVDAFVLHVACAPQQRDDAEQRQQCLECLSHDRSPAVPRKDILRTVVDRCPRHQGLPYSGTQMPKNQKPQLLKSGL